MTKIRKYNGVYKLPIKTHTPVRRPMSKYKTYMQDCEFGLGEITIPLLSPKPITDISTGLENPKEIKIDGATYVLREDK